MTITMTTPEIMLALTTLTTQERLPTTEPNKEAATPCSLLEEEPEFLF